MKVTLVSSTAQQTKAHSLRPWKRKITKQNNSLSFQKVSSKHFFSAKDEPLKKIYLCICSCWFQEGLNQSMALQRRKWDLALQLVPSKCLQSSWTSCGVNPSHSKVEYQYPVFAGCAQISEDTTLGFPEHESCLKLADFIEDQKIWHKHTHLWI